MCPKHGIRRLIRLMAAVLMAVAVSVSCTTAGTEKVDRLNGISYDFHYRNLDSTLYYADKAMRASASYGSGRAEAYNNKAFVSIARMQYELAARQLDSVYAITDNQIELLVADIQQMRLCQRQSHNKEFYTFRESALARLKRISEEEGTLNEHQRGRMVYARSEFHIVTSTYYYYVGLDQQSLDAINEIDPYGEVRGDVAQLLNYYYNVGAGGIITTGTQEEINQAEMDYLFECYRIAVEQGYPFWEANSMQAMSEHLQVPVLGQKLIDDNYTAISQVNVDDMPDSLLAGNLAQRSLDLFHDYGDVYQMAGSYRTLSQCYWYIGDFESALGCLNGALHNDSAIFKAPDLVASIREQLSVVYAALNNKEESHRNRNYYIETQDKTRQDLYLQSRADQLDASVRQLNIMLSAIVVVVLLGVAMLFVFSYLRRREARRNSVGSLLLPLEEWKKENQHYVEQLNERYEDTMEQMAVSRLHIDNNKRLNLEQRAKVSLVHMITPYIDRMLHEIHKLNTGSEDDRLRAERYDYVAELTDRIIEYNDILTQWIQLRKGELSLHIESFALQPLFDIVAHGRRGFQMRDIQLEVEPTAQWVKADRILTLFMINTMADNARKFTGKGGKVTVSASATDDYVEVSVADTGIGMTREQMAEAFSVEKKISNDEGASVQMSTSASLAVARESGHGFGLVNCKGIIEKYKKISSLFRVCDIGVESEKGRGSRFYFRLPKGVMRLFIGVMLILSQGVSASTETTYADLLGRARGYAERVHECNAANLPDDALVYADSALCMFNQAYKLIRPQGTDTLVLQSDKAVFQPEILWYHERLPVDFEVIRLLRNEMSVAALALHEWAVYRYNNKVYTQLYKEMSADDTLEDYCRGMQKSQSNKYMAIVILIILFLLILVAYFFLYYRHQVYYRFCLERVRAMNGVLRSEAGDADKLAQIERLAGYDSQEPPIGGRRRGLYSNERLPQPLQQVADELISTLKSSMAVNQEKMADIDLAEDEVRRCQMENDKLHICNSVLDNCLSTLKHETMYFPSRIRALIDSGGSQLQSISELADYYKELYTLLSAQAMRQVESVKPECVAVPIGELLPQLASHPLSATAIYGDRQMLRYLFQLLKKQGGGDQMSVSVADKNPHYVVFRVSFPSLELSEEERHELFDPAPGNLPFLLCRQIVRDVGESTNARGCGIMAEAGVHGGTDVVVTLVKAQKTLGRNHQ